METREHRRRKRHARVSSYFQEPHVDAALDMLELLEFGWHDCYGDVTPPEDIVDDLLLLSGGSLVELAHMARLALADWRDVKMNVARLNGRS